MISSQNKKHLAINLTLIILIAYELIVGITAAEIRANYPDLVDVIKNSTFLWIPFFGLPFGFLAILFILIDYPGLTGKPSS